MILFSMGHGPGTWRAVRSDTAVRVSCPRCGYDAELDHAIAPDGTVTPSLDCPGGCGFHEHVKLTGYPA